MTRTNQLIFISLVTMCTFFMSCTDEFEKEKYKRPEWLAGKVYTQVKEQPDLSTFAKCLELTGYDTIINRSGSYTVFAPNNEAFSLYFQNNPDYSTVEDIPIPKLLEMVKYHIVQNPWSKNQLRSLDIYGWIDTLDIYNDEPRGFKRETLLFEKDRKFGIQSDEERAGMFIIVDTLETNFHRRVATDSRKYAPIFYKEYFDIYDLNVNDYEYYFGRPIENINDIYFARGRIIEDEIFAENGFVYNIDRVVEPLKNAYEILNTQYSDKSYSKFLDLLNRFPEFDYNEDKTFDQPGAELGYEVDSLFDLTYPELIFDITNEKTKAPSGTYGLPSNVTIRYHHGLIAPTNEALDDFINEYLSGASRWGTLEDAPHHIKRIIANTYMSPHPIYPTNFEKGFYNGEEDIVRLNEGDVIHKEFGSNCTFIGVDHAVVPRAFKSVTGPVYLLKGYSKVMYAIERTGLLPALKRENQNYLFYVESDANSSADSSLLYEPASGRFIVYQISGISVRQFAVGTNDLRTLLLNHVGVGIPKGIARKEFIRNLAGNFIIVNNETGEVSGTSPTTEGYLGSEQVTVIPRQISTDADNGITYDIEDWFSFSATDLFFILSGSYPGFHNLLRKAGLSEDKLYRYSFISENENYTIFAPSDEALNNSGADTLNKEDLVKFLLLHFVQGDFIFTDGNKPSGYYETARIDEKSTEFSTVYTEIYIEPGYDVINIPDKLGNQYLTVNESSATNVLAGRSLGVGTETFRNVINTAVIHKINKVLLFEEVDTR
jgi:uncharacterized surface protein with fasciclin (FAS1) repeats